MTHIMMVAGARPNFMKIAPLVSAMHRTGRLRPLIVHTGQHYDAALSQLMFEQLAIPSPEVRLEVGSGSHAVQTAEIMKRIEPVLVDRRPAAVLVVGDVNSTIAAALVAVKLGIEVVHVEAGLRSFDRSMPEEINRVLTDAISSHLFVSEPSGVDNLKREGAPDGRIHLVGNVMIDTLLRFLEPAQRLGMPARLGLSGGGYAVVTLHRPSNVDDAGRLTALLQPIFWLARRLPVVFPVHPRTRRTLEQLSIPADADVRLLAPTGYLEFLGLVAEARIVVTDSGGVQEETTALEIPCVTMRDNTERPITVTAGTNRLAGTNPERIQTTIAEALATGAGSGTRPDLWDGRAAERIVCILERHFAG